MMEVRTSISQYFDAVKRVRLQLCAALVVHFLHNRLHGEHTFGDL